MVSSDPPTSEGSTRREGVVPSREDLLSSDAKVKVEAVRNFTFGTISVFQERSGLISIQGAEGVPPSEMQAFAEMLAAFVRRASESVIEHEGRAFETLGESECPECQSSKQHAQNEMRKCLNCGFVWRVVPKTGARS